MGRISTRVKRKLGIPTKRKHGNRFYIKKHRPKTFPTEEKAKAYAQEVMKLAAGSYILRPAKKNRRFMVVKK